MGTHAMIGIWNSDTNEVLASYVHYDGYVEGTGRVLVQNYNDHILAQQVALGGYLSALYPNYAQSRKESIHKDPPTKYTSVEEYMNEGYDNAAAHYLYLWDGNAWFFAKRDGYQKTKFEEVEMNLQRG